jgi:hypothetical protein
MDRVVDHPLFPGQLAFEDLRVLFELGGRAKRNTYHLASPSTPDFVLERCAGQVDELRLGLGRAGQDTCQ